MKSHFLFNDSLLNYIWYSENRNWQSRQLLPIHGARCPNCRWDRQHFNIRNSTLNFEYSNNSSQILIKTKSNLKSKIIFAATCVCFKSYSHRKTPFQIIFTLSTYTLWFINETNCMLDT